jgi:hypothetical protein
VTLAIGLIAQAALLAGDVIAYQAGIPQLGAKGDLYRRTLGWRGLGEAVQQKARDVNAKTVVAEGRHELASLVYYLRDAPQPVLSWRAGDAPDNHFDMANALHASAAEPILFVSPCPFEARLAKVYPQVKSLGPLTVSSGPSSQRNYQLFLLSGLNAASGQMPPLGPCRN